MVLSPVWTVDLNSFTVDLSRFFELDPEQFSIGLRTGSGQRSALHSRSAWA